MTNPRGTIVTIRYSNDEARPKRWGVHWNEYESGCTGRPKQRAKFYATQAEAELVQQQVIAELAQPALAITAPVRMHRAADALAAFATDHWLPAVKARNAGATHRNYQYAFEAWLAPEAGHTRYPGLGNVLLTDDTFTKLKVIEYLEGLHQAGVSLSMRKRLKGALSACCGYAVYVGRLKLNPCAEVGRRIKHKGEEEQEAVPNPFAPDEITRIFDQLAAVEELCWQVYFLWQYHVGTRPGEAAALKWTNLDLDRQRARIEHAYCPVDKIDKDPKTHERRSVDLTAALVELLITWRAAQREAAFKRGYRTPEYVFTTRQAARTVPRQLARILQGGTVRTVLTRTLTACAITGHTLYDFRDSFATSHLALGWDRKLPWVSKQLGHSTPAVTQKHYYAYRDTEASRTFADEIGGFK